MPQQRVQVIPLRELLRGDQRSKWKIRPNATAQQPGNGAEPYTTAQDTAWPPYDPSAWEGEAQWQQEVHAYLLELARQEAMCWAGTQSAAAPERIPLWVWCAGVAVVQFLVGCILLLTP
jgi:hypothetical protein